MGGVKPNVKGRMKKKERTHNKFRFCVAVPTGMWKEKGRHTTRLNVRGHHNCERDVGTRREGTPKMAMMGNRE